jgi:hypothetical protein
MTPLAQELYDKISPYAVSAKNIDEARERVLAVDAVVGDRINVLRQKVDTLGPGHEAELEQVRKDLVALKGIQSDVVKVIFGDGTNKIPEYKEVSSHYLTPDLKTGIAQARDFVGSVMGAKMAAVLPGHCDWVIGNPKSGNFYTSVTVDYGTINIHSGGSRISMAHEQGHWVEHNVPGLQDAANYARKNGGFTFAISDYAKKTYPGGATEMVSQGLEQIFSKPGQFAKKDPKFFEWTFRVVRGEFIKGK